MEGTGKKLEIYPFFFPFPLKCALQQTRPSEGDADTVRYSAPPTPCAGKPCASSRSYLDSLAHTVPVLMSPLSQQGSRVFEQEGADACLAQRGAELTCTPVPSCAANPQKTETENYRAREAKAVRAGGRKGKQDANQKGRVHISGYYLFTVAGIAGIVIVHLFLFPYRNPTSQSTKTHTQKPDSALSSQYSCASGT